MKGVLRLNVILAFCIGIAFALCHGLESRPIQQTRETTKLSGAAVPSTKASVVGTSIDVNGLPCGGGKVETALVQKRGTVSKGECTFAHVLE